MAGDDPKRRRRPGSNDRLEPYRRIRKPMPPPDHVESDRRRDLEDEDARRQVEEALTEVRPPAAPPGPASPGVPDQPRRAPDPRFPVWSATFRDRDEGGAFLADALRDVLPENSVVLAIPRGGVEIGAAVAERLGLPLDVVIPRKLGAPGNPELGLGAVAEGIRVLDEHLIRVLGVSPGYLEGEIERQEEEIRRRTAAYREGRAPVRVQSRTAAVVDDGVATGGTAVAALRWARHAGAREVVFAAPVAPVEAVRRLEAECDRVVILATPSHFFAVGQWYVDFRQVGDDRVVSLLRAAAARGA
jgi:putative phosphoribosyl transferase